MEVYEIKATLPRSNPLLLRQFTIDGEKKLQEVGQMLQTLLGWKEMWPCSFLDGGKVILPETPLAAAFAGRSGLTCVLGAKGKQEHTWEFCLKLAGRAAQGDCPRVVRYRGDNLPQDTASTAQYNLLAQNWDGTARTYFNGFCNTHSRQDYIFSITNANRALKRKFSAAGSEKSGVPALELDYRNAESAERELGSRTVVELKDLAKRLEVALPTGLRKEMLMHYLAEEMGKAYVLNQILQSLTLGQYRAFRRICSGDGKTEEPGAMREIFLRLYASGYVRMEYFSFVSDENVVYASRQLLEAYEDWLDTTDEPEYLRLALLRSTVLACTRLYGCLSKEAWKQIVPRIAEKKGYTEEEMEAEWHKMWFYADVADIFPLELDRNILYCSELLERPAAKKLASRQESMPLYVPRIAEIRQLESGGFLYPDPKGKELERFLQTHYNLEKSAAHEIHYQVYQALQFGLDPESYADWLIPQLSSNRRKAGASLKKLFRELVPLTRQIAYGGHTLAEMERMR